MIARAAIAIFCAALIGAVLYVGRVLSGLPSIFAAVP